jgi:hypothetical protein
MLKTQPGGQDSMLGKLILASLLEISDQSTSCSATSTQSIMSSDCLKHMKAVSAHSSAQ